MPQLPYEIREAIVQVFGKAFWLTDSYLSLDAMGNDGWLIQRRLVTELCQLRNVPDETVPSRNEALKALRALKALATAHELAADEDRSAADQRVAEARVKQAALLASPREGSATTHRVLRDGIG